jgi:hypothetical protein
LAQFHKIADGAEMDVGRVIPSVRQVFGDRHAAEKADIEPHAPMAEIRDRDDGALADAQHVFQNLARIARRLQCL